MKECFAAGRAPGNESAACEGVHQAHHWIKQQVLGREIPKERLEEALGDRRGVSRVCDKHHQWISNHRIRFTREELPESVEGFADEHRLGWVLDFYYGQRAA